MKKFWNIRAQAKNPKVVELDIYGTIESNYYDFWSGEYIESETSAAYIKKQIKAYGDISRVELHINSMGGSVREGNAIANMLRRLDAETVAYIDAFACSAASAIACACNKVVMPRNTVLMIHNPSMGAWGSSAELRKAADDLDVLSEAFRTIYLDKAGDKLSEEKLIEMLNAETYLTAEQAHEIGLCDEVEQFDAVLIEPDDNAKEAAAKAHIDCDKLCAMVRGEVKPKEPDPEPAPEPKPEPQAKKEPEGEPDPALKIKEFKATAEALVSKFIK